MRIPTFLFIFPCLIACQPGNINVAPLADAHTAVPTALATTTPATAPKGIVWQSSDGGDSWVDASLGLPDSISVVKLLTNDDQLILASEKGVYRSTVTMAPAVPVWEKLTGLDGRMHSVFPGKSGLYAFTADFNMYQEMPGTGMWQLALDYLHGKIVHDVVEVRGAILAACDPGVFLTRDQGKTWKHVGEQGIVYGLLVSGNDILAATAKGIMRSADGGETWERTLTTTGELVRFSTLNGAFLAIHQGEQTWGATFEAPENRTSVVRISEDGGKTWRRMAENLLPAQRIYDLKTAGKYLFCNHAKGVSRSADGGKTWELVHSLSEEYRMIRISVVNEMVFIVEAMGGC